MSQSQAYQAYLPERCKRCGDFPGLEGFSALPPRCKRCRDLPGLAQALLLLAMQDPPATGQAVEPVAVTDPGPQSPLSDRELEVLQAYIEEGSNYACALKLCVAESTVKFHLRHIRQKLQAGTTTLAIAEGFRRGLIQ